MVILSHIRLHPEFRPLSKIRGSIIRLDKYTFTMGGPNQEFCSLRLSHFEFIGSNSSATFRSPKDSALLLKKKHSSPANLLNFNPFQQKTNKRKGAATHSENNNPVRVSNNNNGQIIYSSSFKNNNQTITALGNTTTLGPMIMEQEAGPSTVPSETIHTTKPLEDQSNEQTEVPINHQPTKSNFLPNDESNCLISSSQMEQLEKMDIPGFSTNIPILVPTNISQPYEVPSMQRESSVNFSSLESHQETPKQIQEPIQETPKSPTPSVIEETPLKPENPFDHISDMESEDENAIEAAVAPRSPFRKAIDEKVASPKKKTVAPKSPLLYFNNSSPVELTSGIFVKVSSPILTSTFSKEASIIQSQVMENEEHDRVSNETDNDSDEISFSQRSNSIFSPMKEARYRNMARPNIYLHTQNPSFNQNMLPTTMAGSITGIEEIEEIKDSQDEEEIERQRLKREILLEKRRENARKRSQKRKVAQTYEVDEKEEDDDDDLASRSLFSRDKEALQDRVSEETTRPLTSTTPKPFARRTQKSSSMKTPSLPVQLSQTLNTDKMMDLLQADAQQERREKHLKTIEKSQKSVRNLVVEYTQEKTIEISKSTTELAIEKPSKKAKTVIVTQESSKNSSNTSIKSVNSQTSSQGSSGKKVNYSAWLDFI